MLEQLRSMGVFDLTLTGGEIFTHPDIMEIIEYARKLGFSLTLYTNGSLLCEDNVKEIKRLFVKMVSATI